jgi:hypothetical protein
MFQYVRVALPVLLLAAGCTGSSSSSTPSTPGAPTPTVSSVTVNGSSPDLGETSQFTATATLSNAATEDVTAQATWQSSDVGVVAVSSAGMVGSVAPGEADITATYSGVTGSKRVSVAAAPAARRTVTGMITDDSTGRPLVVEAEAQVMDGENAGKAGRVDGSGVYSIPDLAAGTFNVRARATGYESRDHRVTIEAADVRVDFALRAQIRDVPCSYTVTPVGGFDSILPVSPFGGEASLTIKRTSGSCGWTATGPAELKLASTSGNGDATLTFTYPANVGSLGLSYSIRVEWSGGSATIGVSQAEAPCSVRVSVDGRNPISVQATGGQFTASIQPAPGMLASACLPWNATADVPGPVSFVGATTGPVPGSVTFTVAANSAAQARTVIVTINHWPGPPAVLTINQAGTQ